MHVRFSRLICAAFLTGCGQSVASETSNNTAPLSASSQHTGSGNVTKFDLGEALFFDTTLSEPPGQSCASCHDPLHAYRDPGDAVTSKGAVSGRYGFRNAPSIIYASLTPELTSAGSEAGYAGGLFWDGRAATLQAQVAGPLLNPVEMNNTNQETFVAKMQSGPYASAFTALYGSDAFADAITGMANVGDAIAAFESAAFSNRFTSKYDAYLAGTATFSDSETRGLALFEDPAKGNCASCHLDKPDANGNPPMFTDFGYDNLGIPKNPNNPFYTQSSDINPAGAAFIDYGLGGSIAVPGQLGKFKAPSLRNIALTAPYGHNGYFADLHSIVDFYNTRDIAGRWDPPEVSFGVNTTDMGNLGLSDEDEDDVVSFLKTLTDGYGNR